MDSTTNVFGNNKVAIINKPSVNNINSKLNISSSNKSSNLLKTSAGQNYQPKKYFIVTCKCGHVGRNQYRKVDFPVCAVDGKTAAALARKIPRVKHHHKDAILNCVEVDYKRFKEQEVINNNDAYLKCKSRSEQDRIWEMGDLFEDEETTTSKLANKNKDKVGLNNNKQKYGVHNKKSNVILIGDLYDDHYGRKVESKKTKTEIVEKPLFVGKKQVNKFSYRKNYIEDEDYEDYENEELASGFDMLESENAAFAAGFDMQEENLQIASFEASENENSDKVASGFEMFEMAGLEVINAIDKAADKIALVAKNAFEKVKGSTTGAINLIAKSGVKPKKA
jgi:hypothetical protein